MRTKIIGFFIGSVDLVLVAVCLSALFAWPVQLLWNYFITSIHPFGEAMVLTFKQAWALSLLCSFLFKSGK